MKRKIVNALRIGCGISIAAGFIATLGIVGADDVATMNGIYTNVGELIKKLALCQVCVLGGTAGLNIL